MKNNKHIRKYITTTLLMLFVSIGTVFAQVNKTVGTRITDEATDKALKTTAILDLDSTTKGFFLPRMTTVQRDELKKKMNAKDNGLAVYNIDIDCVEYWSERTQKWMSLCGSLPPATLDLAANACSSVTFSGFTLTTGTPVMPVLQQGTALNPEAQSMSVRLKVDQIGTYTISATGNNGYFFSAEGQFQSTGTYTIIMKGMGTPTVGYDQGAGEKGDEMIFTINGKESTVCKVKTVVKPADLKFKIKSAVYKAKGKYNVDEAATVAKGNSIELDIEEVNVGGPATVTAYNATLGMKFVGSKDLTANSTDKIILEPVVGEASAKENTLQTYELGLTVNAKDAVYAINGNKVGITIEQTEIEADNAGAAFGTVPYYEGGTLDSTYKIILPVTVIGSGKTNLYLKGAGGVNYTATNVVLRMPKNIGDKQNIEFTATGGTLPNASSLPLTLSGDGTRFAVKNPTVLTLPIGKKPVAYTLDCSTIKANRAAIPLNKPIAELYYLTAKVNVTQVGEYEIKTNTKVDDIEFSTTRNGVKKVFTSTGLQDVTLYAVDGTKEGKNKGQSTVSVISTDAMAVNCGDVKINVGYNDLKVLVITVGTDEGSGQSRVTQYFTGKNASGKPRFGIDGEFVVTGDVSLDIFDMYKGNTAAMRVDWATKIKNKDYNMIVVDGRYTVLGIDQTLADALFEYAGAKYGALIVMNFMESSNSSFSNRVVSNNNTYYGSKQVGQYKDANNSGLKLLDRLNGGTKVLANNDLAQAYFPKVVSKTVDITKPKKGYNYDDSWMLSWYAAYTSPTYFRTTHDTSNGNFKAIVNNAGSASRGLVFENSVYTEVVWFPVLGSWYGSIFDSKYLSSAGEPFITGDTTSPKTGTSILTNNVMLYLIQRIADR